MVKRINGYNDDTNTSDSKITKPNEVKNNNTAASGSGIMGSSKAGRALLYSASKNKNPYYKEESKYSSTPHKLYVSAGESRLENLTASIKNKMNNTNSNNDNKGISKDTAAMLKVIISLIESLESNTDKIDNIYQVLTEYCKANLGNSARATEAINKLQNNNSSDSVDSILQDLKTTADAILAS